MEETRIRANDPKEAGRMEEPEEQLQKEQNRKSKSQKKKKKSKAARIILLSVLGALVLALIGAGVYAWHILNRPNLFFETVTRVTATQTPLATPVFVIEDYLPSEEPGTTPIPILVPMDQTPVPEPNPTPDSNPEETAEPAEPGKLTGIVNVALFGIDAFENGTSSSGTMPHTDANLIVAINFDTNEVSLISIARDCLTTAPGHTGFYKFNGIFNVGGGMKDPYAGFELSCRAAEEWLGGVSVPYYYGVDFQALIDLVDMIGGVDFDVDITIHTMDGRTITPGRRHLNGQGVMAYMRMRRSAGGLDSKRTERQRKMLIAIFQKLKQEGKLSQIPEILKTLGNNVYTNTDLSQTTALVNYAKDIAPENIRSYSIQGEIHIYYDWAFCYIDQEARIDLLKTVYGITAEPMGVNSRVYEQYLHEHGFLALQYLTITKQMFDAIHRVSDANAMTEEQRRLYAVCWKDYSDLQVVYDAADKWMRAQYDNQITTDEQQQFDAYMDTMHQLEQKLQKSADAMNAAFGKPYSPKWNRSVKTWFEEGSYINEVFVDFR